MADKVKLTPPMTDSKTTDWVKEEAVICTFLLGLEPDRLHVLRSSISQALLSAYERGRTEGVEEAAKVADADDGNAPGGFGNPDFGPNVARRIATAIRQLLEVKG